MSGEYIDKVNQAAAKAVTSGWSPAQLAQEVGLDLYEWSTSLDERVREAHLALEGKICRWDDASVYSEDGGKTWKDRPADWSQLHPGYDIQCRCTAPVLLGRTGG